MGKGAGQPLSKKWKLDRTLVVIKTRFPFVV